MSTHYDAIDYARELAAAGVPPEQANIHAKALAAALDNAIRGDLNALGRRMTALIAEVKEELIETEMRLQAQIKESETRTNDRVSAFEARFDAFRAEVNTRFAALEERLRLLEIKVEGVRKELQMVKWALAIMATAQVAMTAKLIMM